ncbi:HAD hydrolase-like protein [Candidatus Poribacteria bacterium]|nr:HAD hydrolase-like protein [Candidatus Poribacteria bacterium]
MGGYMKENLDAVLFDFDGTLVQIDIDFKQMRQGIINLGQEYGIIPETGLYVLESLEYIFTGLLEKDPKLAREFRQRAENLIIDIEVKASAKATAMPGVENTLRELNNKGIKIGIVTRNCRAGVLKSTQVADLVYDILLTRDDVLQVKPHPGHLTDALNLMKSRAEEAIMVGNHAMDIIAGKRAKMKTAAVLTTHSEDDFMEVQPDYIMPGIPGLLDIL